MRQIRLYTMTAVLILTTSCGHVSIYDKEKCVDEGSLGAHCSHTLNSATRDIPQPQWDNERFGWFCQNADDEIDAKRELEELCSVKGVTCDYQAKQNILKFLKQARKQQLTLKAHSRHAHQILLGY
jgi:hypothetical protein